MFRLRQTHNPAEITIIWKVSPVGALIDEVRSKHPCCFLQVNKCRLKEKVLDYHFWSDAQAWQQTCIASLPAKEGHSWSHTLISSISWLKLHLFSILGEMTAKRGTSLAAWAGEDQRGYRVRFSSVHRLGTEHRFQWAATRLRLRELVLRQVKVSTWRRTDNAHWENRESYTVCV